MIQRFITIFIGITIAIFYVLIMRTLVEHWIEPGMISATIIIVSAGFLTFATIIGIIAFALRLK